MENENSAIIKMSQNIKLNTENTSLIKEEVKKSNEGLKNIEDQLKSIVSKLTKFRATIENGELQDKYGNNISSELIENTRAFAVASELNSENKKFIYWKDYSNNIVSYDRKYEISANSDIFLRAIYIEEPVVAFRDEKYEFYENEGQERIKFLTSIDVSDEFKVSEWGVIASTRTDELTIGEDGNVSNSINKLKSTDTAISQSNHADAFITVNRPRTTLNAKVYAIITDSNEKRQVIYSELLKIVKEPIVAFRNEKYKLHPGEGAITYLTTIDIPDEYIVKEWGVLLSTKQDEFEYGDSAILTAVDTDIRVQHSKYADSAIRLEGIEWCFESEVTMRAIVYAVIDKDGEEKVIYSTLLKIELQKHFQVSVEGGALYNFKDNTIVEPGSFLPNRSHFFVIANDVDEEGRKFAYWENQSANGNEIYSYDKRTEFHNRGTDVHLKAVYLDEEIEKKSIVGFYGNQYKVNPEQLNVQFFINLDILDDFEVLEWGILESTKTDELVYGETWNYAISDEFAHLKSLNYELTMEIHEKWLTEHRIIRTKVYAKVKDKDNVEKIIYSKLLKIELVPETYYQITTTEDAKITDVDGNEINEKAISTNTQVFIIANEYNSEGKKFAYFAKDDGTILSYDTTFDYCVNFDLTIIPIYMDEEIEKLPLVAFTSVVFNATGSSLNFRAIIDVPSEYEVVEWGFIAGYEKDDISLDNFYKKSPVTGELAEANKAYWDKTIKFSSEIWFAEGNTPRIKVYAMLKDKDDVPKVIYSNLLRIQL